MSSGKKWGLAAGVLAVVGLTAMLAYSVLKVDYVPVLTHATPEKLASTVREIERLKVLYRVSDDGSTVEVPADQVGRVRVGFAGAVSGGGSSVGFEIFNNSDFSTTEFTQKVNYQRALQGELSRTISAMDGIASARVHLVLAESGYSRRNQYRPTAAVTVATQPGVELLSAQIKGIQRLVAASVPDIKLADIAVLNQSGEALTKTSSGTSDDGQKGMLDHKRDVDSYLEAKLKNLLTRTDPNGDFSISVDATLNMADVKVTQEDVITPEDGKGGRSAGVLVRERQSQRQDAAGPAQADSASATAAGSLTRESEYRVGRRVEQTATAAGGIDRLNVAVVARSAAGIDELRVRELVKGAIGVDEERGDTVAVVVLPAVNETVESNPTGPASVATPVGRAAADAGHPLAGKREGRAGNYVIAIAALIAAVLFLFGWMRSRRTDAVAASSAAREPTDGEVQQIVERVQAWLGNGEPHAAR